MSRKVYNHELLGKLQQLENRLLHQQTMINNLGMMIRQIGDMVNEILKRTPPSRENDEPDVFG